MEKIEDFLKNTRFCDCDNSLIKETAIKITREANGNKEKAISLFYWMRDNILYKVGGWQKMASETLKEGEGVCTSKANLLVAFFRSLGIPAGYGVMRVNGREYFGPIVPSFLRGRISKESIHIYAYVFLSNKWIKCDCSDDKEFSEKTAYFNPQSKLVNWDGEQDAILNLNNDHILKDEGPISNIDLIIGKKSKTATNIMVKMGNLYIRFLRINDRTIVEPQQLEHIFKIWMKKNNLFFYLLFIFISYWHDIKARLKIIRY